MKNARYIECRRIAPFKPRGIDVSVVHDVMIHDIDLVLSLFQEDPKSITAFGQKVVLPEVDYVHVNLEFGSGQVATLSASRISEEAERSITIVEPDGYFRVDLATQSVVHGRREQYWSEGIEQPCSYKNLEVPKVDAMYLETEAFVNSIVNQLPPVVSGHDGVRALKVVEEIVGQVSK